MSWTAEWTKGDRAECRMGSNGVEVWCPGTVVRVGETAVVVALDANPSLEIVQGARYWVTGSGGMTGDIRRPEPVPVAAAIPVDLNVDVALLNVAVDIAPGQRWVFEDDGKEMGPEHDSIVSIIGWRAGPSGQVPAVIVAHARPDDPALVRWERSTFLAKHRRQRRPEELEQGLASGVALQAAAAGPHATTTVARLELATEPVEVAERVEGHCAAQMARLAAYWATKVPGYSGTDLVGDVIAYIEEVIPTSPVSAAHPLVDDLLGHIDALTEERDEARAALADMNLPLFDPDEREPSEDDMRGIRSRWGTGPEAYQADADLLISGIMNARMQRDTLRRERDDLALALEKLKKAAVVYVAVDDALDYTTGSPVPILTGSPRHALDLALAASAAPTTVRREIEAGAEARGLEEAASVAEARGSERCTEIDAYRDCTAWTNRGRRCPECPRDEAEEIGRRLRTMANDRRSGR